MAAAVTKRFAEQGLASIEEGAGLQLFAQLLHADSIHALGSIPLGQVGVAPIDWQKFPTEGRALLSDVAFQVSDLAQEGNNIREKLLKASPSKRLPHLMSYLQGEVAQVLRLSLEEASQSAAQEQGFFDMGMDSLMAIELRNRLQSGLKLPLASTLLFQYASINDLADYLAEELWDRGGSRTAPTPGLSRRRRELREQAGTEGGKESATADHNQMETQVQELSSDQIEDLMATRLAKLETLLGHG